GDKLIADAESFKVELPAGHKERAKDHVGQTCTFGIRPEDIYDRNLPGVVQPGAGNTITVGVDVMEPLGDDVEMYLTSGSHQLIAKLDSKTQAKVGESLDVVLDLEKSHLFDNETEQALY